jgi:hypothetical protein
MFGKYYHFGGLHVGAAIAGTLWYAAFVASGSARTWRRGVTATGAVQPGLAERGSLITITFAQPQASTTLSIGSGALIESGALRAKLRRIAAGGGQTTLTLPVRVIDTSGRTSQSQVTFIARR